MKLHASAQTALNTFSGYGDDFVAINGERHATNVIVTPERIQPWNAGGFDALTAADFAVFAEMDLDVLLLGTGPRQRFPHPRITRALADRRIGLEVMDLQAACRTYNILMAEERRVAAALLFG